MENLPEISITNYHYSFYTLYRKIAFFIGVPPIMNSPFVLIFSTFFFFPATLFTEFLQTFGPVHLL